MVVNASAYDFEDWEDVLEYNSDNSDIKSSMSDNEEEDHDLIGSDEEEEEQEQEQPARSDDEEEGEEEKEEEEAADEDSSVFYCFYNRQYYKFGKAMGSKAGWVRCYSRVVKVPNGKLLGEMVSKEMGWWSGAELPKKISADKIVVLSGKAKEEDAEMKNYWYVLIEVEGQQGKQDHLIARFIPKKVCVDLVNNIKKDPSMATSSLLSMLPYADNAKPLNPQINGFVKVTGDQAPKSGMIAPDKKVSGDKPAAEKKGEASSSSDKKPIEKKKETGEKAKKPAEASEKKSEKPSTSSFFKPKATEEKSRAASPVGPANEGKEKEPEKAEKAEKAEKPKDKEKPKEVEKSKDKEAAPAAASAARESLRPAVGKRTLDDANGNGKERIKKRRTDSVETHEFMICDNDVRNIDFVVPEGATQGKCVITWSFE